MPRGKTPVVDGQESDYTIVLDALRRQVTDSNFALRPHAMQHAVKEGFTKDHMTQVVLQGALVETYAERNRCLLYAEVTIEGLKIPLHVVCEHLYLDAPVDFVTAYIPSQEEWETPTRRRKKRRRKKR
jgi:hypothetical protein